MLYRLWCGGEYIASIFQSCQLCYCCWTLTFPGILEDSSLFLFGKIVASVEHSTLWQYSTSYANNSSITRMRLLCISDKKKAFPTSNVYVHKMKCTRASTDGVNSSIHRYHGKLETRVSQLIYSRTPQTRPTSYFSSKHRFQSQLFFFRKDWKLIWNTKTTTTMTTTMLQYIIGCAKWNGGMKTDSMAVLRLDVLNAHF